MPIEDQRLADRGPQEDVLLQNVTADTVGSWKPTQKRRPIHITVEGVDGPFVGTVNLDGTLQRGTPNDSDNGRVLLMSTTSLAISFSTDIPYAWVKAEVTGYGGGTIYSGLAFGG